MIPRVNLSPTQQRIVDYGEGALLVVAGPGSGKTRVLTERARRILSNNEDHFRILALTFTNKAASEMRERLQEFPDIHQKAFIGTLHSFCSEILASRGKPVGIEKLPNIFELYQDRLQVLYRAIIADPDLSHELKSIGDLSGQDRLLSRWLAMIGEYKNRLVLPDMLDDEVERSIYLAYNAELRASDAVDYDDLLLLAYRLLTERPKIADFYRRQYRYIFIDEAQDLNEAQYRVIQALCGPRFLNIMMVGDPKQAIFVWNGANPKYLDLFEKDFGAERIKMDDNFRSSRCVVNSARALSPDYEIEGQLPIEGEVRLIVGQDEENEANLVLDYLEILLNHGHPDIEGAITLERCALLARNRYVFSTIDRKLTEREWPYYKQLSPQHESESDLIKDFELGMRLLANPRDQLHLALLLKGWNVQYKANNQDRFTGRQEMIDYLNQHAHNDPQKAIVKAIIEMDRTRNNFELLLALDMLEEFSISLDSEDERALVQEDIKAWRKHWDLYLRSQSGEHRSLTSFLGQVALGATQQMRQDGLGLITVHSAKGLEFDVVVVMGMAEGIFPDYRAKGLSLQEEKRNAFVAITRSMRLLAMSYSQTRMMPWGNLRQQQPSRYLRDIGLI
ncbi:ATP-dependent helicase [Chloroflexota bacterium]